MTNELNHYTSPSPYAIEQLPTESEMPEMLNRKKQSILEPHASNTRRCAIPAIAEADAYRPCGTATNITTVDNSSTNTRLPLAVKPLRQYQLKSENLYTSGEYKCNNASIATSSSLPRMSKTALPSSKALCKTLSGDFRQNSQNTLSNDIAKSKCKSETLIGTSMMKFLHGINSNSPINTTTCIARPIYCDNEMTRDSCDTISPLQKAAIVCRTELGTKVMKNLPPTNMSDVPLALSNAKNSTVDIKWEVPKCDIKRGSKHCTIGNPTKSVLKVIRPRRLTVACSTLNDWPSTTESKTLERIATIRENTNGNDSLKRKITRELPKKPWFSSSVDGPPVGSQIRETAIDDDLPCKRLVAPRFCSTNRSASVPIQKPTMVRSGSSQIFRMAATPPPKPTRTYEEALTDLLQTEKSEHSSKSDIKSVRKFCPIMGNSKMIAPKDYRSSRDHSSDSGFGADFRKSSSDTLESSPDVQMSGKWLQALDLPCDSYCSADEDLILEENSLIRFLFFVFRLSSIIIITLGLMILLIANLSSNPFLLYSAIKEEKKKDF